MAIVYVPSGQTEDQSIMRNLAGAAQAGQSLSQQGLKKTQMMWDMRTGDPNIDNAALSRLGYDYYDRGAPAAPPAVAGMAPGMAAPGSTLQSIAPAQPDRSQAAVLAVDPATGKQIAGEVQTLGEQNYRMAAQKAGIKRNTEEERKAIKSRYMNIDITKPEEEQVWDYAIQNGLIDKATADMRLGTEYKATMDSSDGTPITDMARTASFQKGWKGNKALKKAYNDAKSLMKKDESDFLKMEKIEAQQAEAEAKKQMLMQSNQRRSIVAAGRPENFQSRDAGGQFLELQQMAEADIDAAQTYSEKLRAYERYKRGFQNLSNHWRWNETPSDPASMGVVPPSRGGGGPGKTVPFRYLTGEYNNDGTPKVKTGKIPEAYMTSEKSQENFLKNNFGITDFNSSNMRFESANTREQAQKFDEEQKVALLSAEQANRDDAYSEYFSLQDSEDAKYNADAEKRGVPTRSYNGKIITLAEFNRLNGSGKQSANAVPSSSGGGRTKGKSVLQ